MARASLYTAMLLVIFAPSSVFASHARLERPPEVELIYKTSGMELLDKLEVAIGKEPEPPGSFQGLVAASPQEANLAREFDMMLNHAFHALLKRPQEATIHWAVEQLYFIFITHVGQEAVADAETQHLVNEIIYDFVKPLNERDPKSCVMLLEPQMAETVH